MAPSDPLRMSQYWEQPCQPFYLVLRHRITRRMCKVLVECEMYRCPEHGPKRIQAEIAAILGHFETADEVWLMVMPDDLQARKRLNQRRHRKGGEYVTIRRHGEPQVVLSERHLKGRMESGVRISFSALVEVLYYEMRMPGIYRVRASMCWTPLRPKGRGLWERLAKVMGARRLEAVMARMRVLYACLGRDDWPDDEEWPLDLHNLDGKALFEQAYADVTELL